MKKIIFSACLLIGIFSFAQNPTEVNLELYLNESDTSSSDPNNFLKLGNKMVFEANDFNNKLFSYENGVFNSVGMTHDGIKIEDFKVLIPKNDHELYFMGRRKNGNEVTQHLFFTGLTEETTHWLAEVNWPDQFTVVNEKLYYINKGEFTDNATSIYYTDGTLTGTGELDIQLPLSHIDHFKAYNNQLYFSAKLNTTSQIFRLSPTGEVVQLTNFTTENFTIYDYIFKDEQQVVLNVIGNAISNTVNNQVIVSDCINGNCSIIATQNSRINRLNTKNKSILKLDHDVYYAMSLSETNDTNFDFFRIDDGRLVALEFVLQGNRYQSSASKVFEPFKFKGDWFVPINGFEKIYRIKDNKVNIISNISGSSLFESQIIVTPNHFYYIDDEYIYKSDGTYVDEPEIVARFSSRSTTDVYRGKRNVMAFDGVNIFYQSSETPKGFEPWIYNTLTGENSLFHDMNIKWIYNIHHLKSMGNHLLATYGNKDILKISHPDIQINHLPFSTTLFESSFSKYSIKYKNKGDANYFVYEDETNRSHHRIFKENLATNTYDLLYTNQRYYQDHGFLEATIYDDYLYFKGENPQATGKYKLYYNPLNSTEKIIVNHLPNEQDYTLTDSYIGLFELNREYYFSASGTNNGTIMRTNLGSSTASIAHQFRQGSDTNKSRILAKINGDLIVNYNQNLYKYNGISMTQFNEGNGFDYYSENEISGVNPPVFNNKMLVYKNTNLSNVYEVWAVNDTESVNLDLYTTSTKLNKFLLCNRKAYFVTDDNILYETDGTSNGTIPIDALDNDYANWMNSVKCINNNLIFINNVDLKTFGILNEEGRRNYRVNGRYTTLLRKTTNPQLKDIEILGDRIYAVMSTDQTAHRLFYGDANQLNLSNLSTSDAISENPTQRQTKLKIYPNPVGNELNVKLNHNEMVHTIDIVDMNGKRFNNPSYSIVNDQLKISTNQLLVGLYFIKISTDKSTYSNQFIKK